MQIAQINIGRPRYPLDDPRMADFVGNLDRINALAERSDGFVWRLKDETGNATQISAFDDPSILLNMSVWQSVETLEAFAYQTVHRRFVQRRDEWFELFDGLYLALWWVEEDHTNSGGRSAAAGACREVRADRLGLHIQEAISANRGCGAPRRRG